MRCRRTIRKVGGNTSRPVWKNNSARFNTDEDGINIRSRQLKGAPAYVNGSSQYSENMVERMLATIPSLVSSVAVISMNTFLVFSVILLCSELMIGGIDSTVSLVS